VLRLGVLYLKSLESDDFLEHGGYRYGEPLAGHARVVLIRFVGGGEGRITHADRRDSAVSVPRGGVTDASIKLDQFLKFHNLVASGGEAKVRIRAGEVRVNSEVEMRRGRKLALGDVVEIDGVRADVVEIADEP